MTQTAINGKRFLLILLALIVLFLVFGRPSISLRSQFHSSQSLVPAQLQFLVIAGLLANLWLSIGILWSLKTLPRIKETTLLDTCLQFGYRALYWLPLWIKESYSQLGRS